MEAHASGICDRNRGLNGCDGEIHPGTLGVGGSAGDHQTSRSVLVVLQIIRRRESYLGTTVKFHL